MKSKADLHLHTNLSDGLSSPKEIINAAVKAGINVIAITDHNTIKPARITKELALKQKAPLEIIIGEEVFTIQGELIGLFLKNKIAHSLDVFKTAEKIKAQGGLAIIPHLKRLFHGYSLGFKEVTELNKRQLIDGLEIYNFWDHNFLLAAGRAKANKKWQLAMIGSSDSHHAMTVGKVYTNFPGKNADDLKKALVERKTLAVNRANFLDHCLIETGHLIELLKRKKSPGPDKQIVKVGSRERLNHMIKLLKE
ncbi:MAG: PHP domain-containing protein [Patescibacteria group bacterium]